MFSFSKTVYISSSTITEFDEIKYNFTIEINYENSLTRPNAKYEAI